MTPAAHPRFARRVVLRSGLVVIGRFPELGEELARELSAVHVSPMALEAFSSTPAAIAVDLRDLSADALLLWRRQRPLLEVPLLLVSSEPVDEQLATAVGAADVIAVDTESGGRLARRLRLAVDLGRARLAGAIADAVIEASGNALSIVDTSTPETPLVEVSSYFEQLTQYADDEVLGRNCRLLQRGDRDQPGVDRIRRAVVERTATTAIVRNYRKDGSLFWNELRVVPLDFGGEPTRWMAGVQRDVSPVMQARAEVDFLYRRLSEQQCFDHEVLDAVEVGIITTDVNGLVSHVNRAARELLDLDESALGTDVAETFGLSAPPGALLALEPKQTMEIFVITRAGAEVELELTITRGNACDEVNGGYFLIFRDAREDRRRELERRRFEHLAAMGTMVAGFAHEVRNPVAALRSLTEELAEELATRELHMPHPARMLRVLERVERLVRTSLQFGRPAAPRRAAHRPWTICSAALAGVGPRTMAAGEEIRVDMDTELPDVFVDDGQLVQAIVILLDNALDAAGRPSKVLLRVTRAKAREPETRARKTMPPPPPAWLRFEVLDEGPGIAPPELPRIFDPFYTTKPTGTGLGLSIAQQIATDNGGRIELSSAPGHPTMFALVIPAADEAY